MDILDAAIKDCQNTIEFAKTKKDQALLLRALDRLDKFLRISFKVKGINADNNDDIQVENDYSKLTADFDFLAETKAKREAKKE